MIRTLAHLAVPRLLAALVLSASIALAAPPLVLFDAAHEQKAGNADWTIDGGFSDMADCARFLGCSVESQDGGLLNRKRLSDVDVLVSPEPNRAFRDDEKTAMREFVERGGSLFLVVDHAGSDRDNDGIDSTGVVNQLTGFLGGLSVNPVSLSEAPVKGTMESRHPIMQGVARVGTWAGASISVRGPTAVSLVTFARGGAYAACAEVGRGRIVLVADSSAFDDGSGAPGDKLHDGWNNPGFNHARLGANCFRWLLRRDTSTEADRQAFLDLMATLPAAEAQSMRSRLDTAVRKHRDALRQSRDTAVRSSWQEDLDRLQDLRGLAEGRVVRGDVRTSRTLRGFDALHR